MTADEPDRDPEADKPIGERVAEGGQYGDPEGYRPDIAPPDDDEEAEPDADERPDACTCTGDEDESLPCWYCYEAGFQTPNPDPPRDDCDGSEA